MKAKLTILGSGTSSGVPMIGCNCRVCKSADPKDSRLRASALVEYGGLTILVDCGPDFRLQAIRAGISHLDGILLTHNHMDHIGGLDDTRALNLCESHPVNIYCERYVEDSLRHMYAYAFADHKYPGAPEWHVHLIDERPFRIDTLGNTGELEWVHDVGYFYRQADGSLSPSDNAVREAPHDNPDIIPIRGYHDQLPVLGFRVGNIAYITDMSRLPQSELPKLEGLEHLTLNTVGYHPHHSHFSLEEAIALSQRIGARHTWLTHLSHAFPPYEEFSKQLPEGILPAYDGLTITD